MQPFRVHGYLKPGFDIIAHRGSQSLWPENTLVAFENALTVYADAILELDVRRTQDGQIVVFHDDTTERTCDKAFRVSNKTLEELRALDAAYKFTLDGGLTFPFRGQGIQIPTLTQVLHAFPAARVSIDIKDVINGHVVDVLDVVRSADAINRVIIASESDENLEEVRRLDSRFATGYGWLEVARAVFSDAVLKGKFFPNHGDILQVPIESRTGPAGAIHLQIVTPSFIDLAHTHGKKVHVWTINNVDEMRQLIEMGVDGIVTDAPGLLVKVARELNK